MATAVNPSTSSSISIGSALASVGEWLRRITVRISSGHGAQGSGVIWRADGLIVTNAHVATADVHEVELPDGRTLTGRLLARDARSDLAALQVGTSKLVAAATRSAWRIGGRGWQSAGWRRGSECWVGACSGRRRSADRCGHPISAGKFGRSVGRCTRLCCGCEQHGSERPWLRGDIGSGVAILEKRRASGDRVTRVLVWSKSAVVRTGLQSIVQAEPDLQLVGLEKRLADFCDAVREAVPDVVLLDVEGFARVQLVELESPAVVALVTTTRRAELQRLLHDGIRAILMRDVGAAEIVAAIRAVANGLAVISPEILDVLLPVAHEAALDDELPAGEPLTAREAEVLAMLADGAANKEIAARLGLSEHTVKFHVSSILNKMGATTRTEAVARGYREGLIAM